MKHPNDPETGDLVRLDSRKDDFSLPMFPKWESGGYETRIGEFKYGELAVILEDLPTNGNGCKILTQCGKVGWVNVHFLKRVK